MMNNQCPRCDMPRVHCICGTDQLTQERTCPNCHNRKSYCTCGKRRNTSGQPMTMQHYTDYTKEEDYAVTSKIYRDSPEKRRIIAEYYPMPNEALLTWIERTDVTCEYVMEFSYNLHMGVHTGKQPWASHRTSRICPTCGPNQLIQMARTALYLMKDVVPLHKIYWKVETDNLGNKTYTLTKEEDTS